MEAEEFYQQMDQQREHWEDERTEIEMWEYDREQEEHEIHPS